MALPFLKWRNKKVENNSTTADVPLLVAAIDFGTTYSGWAYSFRHDYEREPTKVNAKNWCGGQLVSHKAPTCILIREDGKTFEKFGYEAETMYADLITEEKHQSWYFFRRFKMLLFDKKPLGRNVMIKDEGGKTLAAKTVFSLSIKYLMDDLVETCENNISNDLKEKDINWVLTVPAIWNDAAKQFMREAAQEAGIPGNKLTITLEPEAASLYCRFLPVEMYGKDKTSLACFSSGKRYLILDAGGGTVDITVHEVMKNGHLKELNKASGGAWGGTEVDEAYVAFLSEITGPEVMSEFRGRNLEDFLTMFREFEVKKREIKPDQDSKVTFRFPAALADLVKEIMGQPVSETIQKSNYASQVMLLGDKLRVDAKVAISFFKPSVIKIISHIHSLLQKSVNKDVEAILMVGGFSESRILQDAVRSSFKNCRTLVPIDTDLAVLKGAVLFGHSPAMISQRISKFTYGTNISEKFDPKRHPLQKRIREKDGSYRCDNVFSKLVVAGQTLIFGEAQAEKIFAAVLADQRSMGMDIYATPDKNPKFTDEEGCRKIGKFEIPLSGIGVGRIVSVRMIFGGTEIVVECTEKSTKKVYRSKVDFL